MPGVTTTTVTEGELHSCERLNLGIVNQWMRAAMDAAFEAGGAVDPDAVWLVGRAVTVGLLLDLVERAGGPPMFDPEADPARHAEGWRGRYRGVPIRQVRPEWNPAMRLDELWIVTEGNPRVTIIRDNEVMDGRTVQLRSR